MSLTRWAPFQELDSIERRVRRALEDVGFAPALVPAADVYETDDEVVVELEVPGYTEAELSLEVTDHTLVVKGAREDDREERQRSYRLHERLERSFERRFVLPGETDTERLEARFGEGILEVHGKRIPAKPKTVPIATRT
jgi:HSP20 family protein